MKLQPFPNPRLPVPFVVLSFKGQLLIRPAADSQSCKISVNYNTSTTHRLDLVFEARRPNNQVDQIATLHDRLEDTFSIEVTTQSQGVYGFVPTTGAIFDRSSASSDRQDLRWAIDLQNPREFHNFDLKCDDANVEPGILMKDGVFYTFDKSDRATLFVNRNRPGDVLPLPSIGTVIGAIIEPPATGKSVLVKWKEGGHAKSAQLPRGEDPTGTYYSISVVNEPPSGTDDTGHDELDEYYRVLTKMDGSPILSNERFKLEMVHLNSFDGDRIPCMSIFLGE